MSSMIHRLYQCPHDCPLDYWVLNGNNWTRGRGRQGLPVPRCWRPPYHYAPGFFITVRRLARTRGVRATVAQLRRLLGDDE